MGKMEFKSREELEKYVNAHQEKYLGSGIDGRCVLLDNGRVIKLLHKTFNPDYALQFKEISSPSFIFADEAICINGEVCAVIMDYAKGKRLSDNKPLGQNIITLGNQLRKLTFDICRLSDKGVLIKDFTTSNIMYDGEKFTVIDTFPYLLIPHGMFKKENLREVMTTRNGIYPFLLSDIMKYRAVWENQSYYGRLDCLEYPNNYFEELKSFLENTYGEEINTLGDAEMVLKRSKK